MVERFDHLYANGERKMDHDWGCVCGRACPVVLEDEPAVVTTHERPCADRPIRGTADVREGGFLKVSAFDGLGRPLGVADAIAGTVTRGELKWDRKIEAAAIPLRFDLRRAKVYSFRIDR